MILVREGTPVVWFLVPPAHQTQEVPTSRQTSGFLFPASKEPWMNVSHVDDDPISWCWNSAGWGLREHAEDELVFLQKPVLGSSEAGLGALK